MSSIDNSLEGGGSASASGKKGVIQLSDGNFNLTSNKELTSYPKTGTITTTGLTTTGTVFAATLSTSNLVADTITNLTVIGDATITGNAVVDGFVQGSTLSAADFIGSGDGINDLNASNVTSGTLDNLRLPGTISVSNLEATANLVVGGPVDITGTLSAGGSLTGPSLTVSGDVLGTSASLGAIDGSSVVVTGDVQGLNLTSTGTLSAAGITSSAAVNVTGTIGIGNANNGLEAVT